MIMPRKIEIVKTALKSRAVRTGLVATEADYTAIAESIRCQPEDSGFLDEAECAINNFERRKYNASPQAAKDFGDYLYANGCTKPQLKAQKEAWENRSNTR
jgi:hypothetical protein